jgi:hypothetical protein
MEAPLNGSITRTSYSGPLNLVRIIEELLERTVEAPV